MGINLEDHIQLCDFETDKTTLSFLLKKYELDQGVNIFIFSPLMLTLLHQLNYNFDDPSVDGDTLANILNSDLTVFDYTVLIVVHGDIKKYFSKQLNQAFIKNGARRIDAMDAQSPYLLVFHTKYGVMYEEIGTSGSCMTVNSSNIIKKLLISAKHSQNDQL